MSWVRASYWLGAGADAVVGLGMVYPPLLAALLGIDPPPSSVEVRAALNMGSALMLGWTALLVWGSMRPVERRGVLLLTVCPVIVGLALSTLYAYASSYIPWSGAMSVWTLQAGLCATFLSAYRTATALARRQA